MPDVLSSIKGEPEKPYQAPKMPSDSSVSKPMSGAPIPKPPMPKPPMPKPPIPKPPVPKPPVPKSAEPAFTGGGDGGLRVSFVNEAGEEGQPKLGKRLVVMVIVLVVEMALLAVGFFLVTRAVNARVAERDALALTLTDLDQKVFALESTAKTAAAYNLQIAATGEALDKHYAWTKFFEYLEAKTKPTVQYITFSGDADSGAITVDAIGMSYRDVAEQLVFLREEPLIAEVRSNSATAQVSATGEVVGVAFTMVIKLKPEVWLSATAAGAVASPAANVNKCEGTPAEIRACFDEGLKNCALTDAVLSGGSSAPSDHFEVVGPGPGGCLVRRTVTDQVNPLLNGASMTCAMNATRTLAENLTVLATTDWIACTGTLVPLLKGQNVPSIP